MAEILFALAQAGVTQDLVDGWSATAQGQSSFPNGHFWEQGVFAVLANIAPMVADPDKFHEGLLLMRDYMHSKGITFGNEPRWNTCKTGSGYGEFRYVQPLDAISLVVYAGRKISGTNV